MRDDMDEKYIYEIKYENGASLFLEAESMSEAMSIAEDTLKDRLSNRIASVRNLPMCRLLEAKKRKEKVVYKGLKIVKTEKES